VTDHDASYRIIDEPVPSGGRRVAVDPFWPLISLVLTGILPGVLMLAMFPLTAILIVPTNVRLLKIDPKESEVEAEQLHERWGKMHALRTVLGCLPFLIFVATLSLRG